MNPKQAIAWMGSEVPICFPLDRVFDWVATKVSKFTFSTNLGKDLFWT